MMGDAAKAATLGNFYHDFMERLMYICFSSLQRIDPDRNKRAFREKDWCGV